MKLRMLLLGLFLVGFTVASHAQKATPKVSKRQVNQQKRIGHGVKNGELTRGEAVKLQKQQGRIRQSKKNAKADGVVTKKERVGIHARQNAASKNIAYKKNNARSRKH